ncbi:MAG: GxxExxY protein [Conexivisphaerales archaeon]
MNNTNIVENIIEQIRVISTYIYRQFHSREFAYRNALAHELQIRNYSVLVEVPITYRYKDTKGNIINIGMGKADIMAYIPNQPVVIIIELKAREPFLMRKIETKDIIQIEEYVHALQMEYPEYAVVGLLINFQIPIGNAPEMYIARGE